MRFMIFVKANDDTEAGTPPTTELFTAMMKFNQELVDAGVMKDGEGLKPSSQAVRVQFDGDRRTVIDGPFAETKELVAGYWLWECESLAEAVAWAKRCPNPTGDRSVLEIRPLYEAEDFGDEFTPELREQEEQMRKDIAAEQ